MSDSEEDFASADEGEVGNTEQKKPAEKDEKGKNTKENQGAKSGDGGKQTKSDAKKTSVKGKNEDSAARNKKKSEDDSKKSNTASKPQEVSSAKGKQPGNQKKGKQKGGKKNVKEVTVKDNKPDVTETTVNKAESENIDGNAIESDNTTDGINKTQAATKNEEISNMANQDVTDIKVDPNSENTTSKDTHKVEDNEKLSENSVVSKTESLNTQEVNTPTKSDNNSDVKTKSESTDLKSETAGLMKSPSTQSIPRLQPDHTEDQERVLERLAGAADEPKQSGWGWGWGSSLLNVASTSVSTFTNQVGEGFNTMLETVESTLNVPSPEDLVMKAKDTDNNGEEENESGKSSIAEGVTAEKIKDEDISDDKEKPTSEDSSGAGNQSPTESSNSWFSAWGVGNITKMVESTGKNLVTGSLDVLETLGKKTFDALNEHDPGLKKTRGLLKDRGDKPNLSAILRDACEQHEERVKLEKESEEARKVHFGTLFDDFQGLAHLEALEILSNQSERKVNSLLMALPADVMGVLKPQLLEIKTNFEIGEDEEEEEVDEHDFTQLLSDIFSKLNIGTSPDKLTRVQGQIRDFLQEFGEKNTTDDKPAPKEIHLKAIQSLAEFTSKSIEQFHKAGEMVLLQRAQNSDFVSASKQLHSLTRVLCTEVGILSSKFTECLNNNSESEDASNINQLVTSVYLEASNSSSYVQDGFQLLLPVLQQAAIEKSQEPES